jgi:hypothetical protein
MTTELLRCMEAVCRSSSSSSGIVLSFALLLLNAVDAVYRAAQSCRPAAGGVQHSSSTPENAVVAAAAAAVLSLRSCHAYSSVGRRFGWLQQRQRLPSWSIAWRCRHTVL